MRLACLPSVFQCLRLYYTPCGFPLLSRLPRRLHIFAVASTRFMSPSRILCHLSIAQSVGGDILTGVDYIIGGASPESTPPSTPPRAMSPPQPLSPPRPVSAPQPLSPPRAAPPPRTLSLPIQTKAPSKTSSAWQIKGGKSQATAYVQQQPSPRRTPLSSTTPWLNFRMTHGPTRDRLGTAQPKHAFSTQGRHARAIPTPMVVSPPSVDAATPVSVSPEPSGAEVSGTGAAVSVVQLQAHPSYVPYDVPRLQAPESELPETVDPPPRNANAAASSELPQPTAFTCVEPASFPESGFGHHGRDWNLRFVEPPVGDGFEIVSPSKLQASMGGDGDAILEPPPRITITRGEDAVTEEIFDHRFYQPHGDFFYLRNLGEGVRFYRRQIFKNHDRRKKRFSRQAR
eukprot:Gregarina_sp_Poly_1__7805@NODE_441_length_8354_cov_301_408350_g77_i1_p3_GENE_NODE_441_length_8354_cov_301_408350_g77_i1NODE_441_length_8354_cov_301_408350_g77_i1_p3_ORF_typecomplete_len400_score72_46_NODE_441_length_8354_cov_301_408350_g77_i1881287